MQSARIRLEGRLERVEQTIVALERGLDAARRDEFELLSEAVILQQSPEVQEACEQVQRLSGEDGELQRTMLRMWKLLNVAEQRVVARGKKLKMTPAPLALAVRGLVVDPVVYAGRPNRRWAAWALLLGGVSVPLLIDHYRFGILPVILATLVQHPKLAPIDVMVTRRRLVMGDLAVPIADIKRAAIVAQGRGWRGKSLMLTVELADGQRHEHPLPERALKLVEALKAVGLDVADTLAR